MSACLVVGAGAAGCMAAYAAAKNGHEVILIDRNEKVGKKLYITGKGRCNFTNDAEREQFFSNIVTNPVFFRSAYAKWSNRDMIDFVEEKGCPIKRERGGRMFPESDHASDITKALLKALNEAGVDIMLNTEVTGLCVEDDAVCGVTIKGEKKLTADSVIVATGGRSYPATGSDGGFYNILSAFSFKINEPLPALVDLICKEDVCKRLMGLSLRNVSFLVECDGKTIYKEFGEMLFTDRGVSGPIVLSASSVIAKKLKEKGELNAYIDLKPALDEKQLSERIIRECSSAGRKKMKSVYSSLLPASLAKEFDRYCGVGGDTPAAELKKGERSRIVRALKAFPLTVIKTGGFERAVITQGGVDVKEIEKKTLESKRIKGLYIAGELLDIDAFTGGFNLQIAFSTGYLAGSSIR